MAILSGRIFLTSLQSHIWLTASSYMEKYLRISSYIRKPFLIYDFATASLWISLYMRKIWFSFLSVYTVQYTGISRTAINGMGVNVIVNHKQDFQILHNSVTWIFEHLMIQSHVLILKCHDSCNIMNCRMTHLQSMRKSWTVRDSLGWLCWPALPLILLPVSPSPLFCMQNRCALTPSLCVLYTV